MATVRFREYDLGKKEKKVVTIGSFRERADEGLLKRTASEIGYHVSKEKTDKEVEVGRGRDVRKVGCGGVGLFWRLP